MRYPMISNSFHSFPREVGVLAAPQQRTMPEPYNLIAESYKLLEIGRDAIISAMSSDHGRQPLSLFRNWLMQSYSHLKLNFQNFASHLLCDRVPSDRKLFLVSLDKATNVGKTQEVKSFRFPLATLSSVVGSKAAKLQYLRFNWMQFKAELEHALFELCQKLLGLRSMLKSDNKVVGPSNDDHLTSRSVLTSLLRPKIQDVVKIDVRKQGADAPTLRHSFFRLLSLTIKHDSGLQPFLDQADHALILNSMFDKFDQPFVVEVIEKSSDVSIQDPVHLLGVDADVQGVETVVLPSARSVSIRKSKEVSFIDCIQNLCRGSLNDFILQHRYPQGALFAVGFCNEHSSHWLCLVPASLQSLAQRLKIFFKILFVADPRFSVDSSRRTLLQAEERGPQHIDGENMVHQTGELHRFVAPSDFAYTIQRMLHAFPVLSPVRVLLGSWFPLAKTLPSIPLRRRLYSTLVRELRRYYSFIRLPMTVHHRLASLDFTMRTAGVAPAVDHGISRFSRRLKECMLKVSDPAWLRQFSPLQTVECCLPRNLTASAPGFDTLSGLNTWPAFNPVNASSAPLRIHPHDSGSLSMASRLKVNNNINIQSAGLSRRTRFL